MNVTRTPAEIYDEMFVPALFAHWGPVLCDAARFTAVRPSRITS